jgi:Type IV secretion-system coupling protein DNA-binding domain
MNAYVDRAVRRRADLASLHVWAQMALRTVVLIALLWTLLTVALVWYWTGHYGGLAAHQYFGSWFLAWFLTQVIPLTFASLPYRGRRYPIASMYDFLNRRYYLGGSFAGWFWHYAPWGAVITALIVGACLLIIFPPRGGDGDEYVRGTDVVPSRRLRRDLRGDGVELGSILIPRGLESQHFLLVGAPGSGKSTAIRRMLRQIEARGDSAVVLDPECEYVPEFFRPERGDLILNPLDTRCPAWTPWSELRPGSEAMDTEAFASALVPDPANTFSQGGADFFFRQSARTLIVGLLDAVKSREPGAIPKLLALPRAKLKAALRGTPAEVLIDPGAHEQGAGIVATAFNATSSFRHLPQSAEQAWSALEWARMREGWLFLSSTEDSREAALPLQSVWLDCIVRRLMADDGSRGKVWIIADELPVLRRQAELETLGVRGRKRGLCAVLGLQAITQLRAIYGHDQTATLAAAPATKLILRTGEAETARWSSSQIGEREVTRGLVGQSALLSESRDGFTIHPHRQVESVALASEIQMLRPFEGYLCITGYRRAKVTIPYLAPLRRHPGFICRTEPAGLLPNPDRANDSSGPVLVPPGSSDTRPPRPPRRLRA